MHRLYREKPFTDKNADTNFAPGADLKCTHEDMALQSFFVLFCFCFEQYQFNHRHSWIDPLITCYVCRPHICIIRDYKRWNSRVNIGLTFLLYVCVAHTHELNPRKRLLWCTIALASNCLTYPEKLSVQGNRRLDLIITEQRSRSDSQLNKDQDFGGAWISTKLLRQPCSLRSHWMGKKIQFCQRQKAGEVCGWKHIN